MKTGINIDDKEMRKDSRFYISFLEKLKDFYPRIEAVEITYSSLKCAKPYDIHEVKEITTALSAFPFEYTVHFDKLIDWCFKDFSKAQQELSHCLEFCEKIKCSTLSIHCINPVLISFEKFNRNFYHSAEREQQDKEMMEAELTIVQWILVTMKNTSIQLLIENALPKINASHYSYAIDPRMMITQIQKIKNDKISICFDWGHAFLASEYLNWNFEEILKTLLPFASQMHVHNNYGHPTHHGTSEHKHLIHPHADFHLPLYEGKIPYQSLFHLLNDFKGLFLMEYTFSNCNQLWESISKSLEYIENIRR